MISPDHSFKTAICETVPNGFLCTKDFFSTMSDESKWNRKKMIRYFLCIVDQFENDLLNYFKKKSNNFEKIILQMFQCNYTRKHTIQTYLWNSNNNNVTEIDEINNNMSDIRSNSGNESKGKVNCEDKKVILNLAEEKAIVLKQMKMKEEKRKQLRAVEEENRRKQEEFRLQEKRRITEINEKDKENQMKKFNNLIKCDEYLNFQKDDVEMNKDQTKTHKTYMRKIPAKKEVKPVEITPAPPVESKVVKKSIKELKSKPEVKENESDVVVISDVQSDQAPKEGEETDENLKNRTSLSPLLENEEILQIKEEPRKGDIEIISSDKSIKLNASIQEEPAKDIPKDIPTEAPKETSTESPKEIPKEPPKIIQIGSKTAKPAINKNKTNQRISPSGPKYQKSTRAVKPARPIQPARGVRSGKAATPIKGRKPNNAKSPNKKETQNAELNAKEQEINVIEPVEEDSAKPSITERESLVKKNKAGCCQTDVKSNKSSIKMEKEVAKIDSPETIDVEDNNIVSNNKTPDANNPQLKTT